MKLTKAAEVSVWALVALAAGAVLGIVFAPLDGKGTRQRIAKAAGQTGNYFANTGQKLQKKSQEWIADAKGMMKKKTVAA